ncbi:ATP-dependent nuclease [Mycolicibacterium hodleri]|uniref:AAA family ATPase n=1 Tax=Mycolicibacterium hodleri TaxID=49897 RepID=A0A502E9Z0_9MYCO|nr:ATP-binding protein [Mycolicibacterium hodleri]TPG33789.1 AAA family ATPase [Mycolicibacterium hodleri]
MRIRRVDIENFRGIKELTWIIAKDQNFVCLIGPGDSTKTTILDAMYLALSERYSLSLSDADFHNANVDQPISIRVTIDELSRDILKHGVLGMELSGIKDSGELTHDPADGDSTCVVIQLKIEADLEPIWTVYREGDSEPFTQVGVGARKQLGAFKVDERIDGHLRWTRTSALGRMTETVHGAAGTLAAATRASRDAVAGSISADLQALTDKVQARLNTLGGGNFLALKPGLDTSLSSSAGVLALYEERVPLTSYGLGTRRLAGIATQQLAFAHKTILMIDEVEYGLEPHRLVYLLHHLRQSGEVAQVFVTTHSPVAVEQLSASDLCVVRSDLNGTVSAHDFTERPNRAQAVLRSNPSAFLSRKVIFGEGKTEFGLLLGLVDLWNRERLTASEAPAASFGVAVADGGGGSNAPRRARLMNEAGYDAVVLMDNDDRSVDSEVAKAGQEGVTFRRWDTGHDTERELVATLTATQLTAILAIGVENRVNEQTVLQDLANRDESGAELSALDVDDWIANADFSLVSARALIASAAKEYSWFKNPYQGRRLAEWIIENRDALAGSTLIVRIDELHDDIYGAESAPTPPDPDW